MNDWKQFYMPGEEKKALESIAQVIYTSPVTLEQILSVAHVVGICASYGISPEEFVKMAVLKIEEGGLPISFQLRGYLK